MEGLHNDLIEQNGQLDPALVATGNAQQPKPTDVSSVSLSSPEQSEPDSDFAHDGTGIEAGSSRPGTSDDEASDDSLYGANKR